MKRNNCFNIKIAMIVALVFVLLLITFAVWYLTLSDVGKVRCTAWSISRKIYFYAAVDDVVEGDLLNSTTPDDIAPYFAKKSYYSYYSGGEQYQRFSLAVYSTYLLHHISLQTDMIDEAEFINAYTAIRTYDDSLFVFREAFVAELYNGDMRTIDTDKAIKLAQLFEKYRGLYPEKSNSDLQIVMNDARKCVYVSLNLMTQVDLYEQAGETNLAKNLEQINSDLLADFAESNAS